MRSQLSERPAAERHTARGATNRHTEKQMNDSDDTTGVQEPTQGGDGGGPDLGERVTRIETKLDTLATREELKEGLSALRDELKGEIAATREDLARVEAKQDTFATRDDLSATREELKGEIAATREDLKEKISAQTRWMVVTMLGLVGTMVALAGLFLTLSRPPAPPPSPIPPSPAAPPHPTIPAPPAAP